MSYSIEKEDLRLFCRVLGSTVVSIIFWIFTLPSLLLLVVVRYFIQKALDFQHGKGRFTLSSGIDSNFAHDQTPGSSSAIHSLLIHEGETPTIHDIRSRFTEKVFRLRDKTGSYIYKERLQRRFVPSKWGWPVWEDMSKEFDIRKHVRVLESPTPVTESTLMTLMGKIMQDKEVVPSNPQWECILIPSFVPKNAKPNTPYFATFTRLHHAYGDGASFLILQEALGDAPISWTIDPMKPLKVSLFFPTLFAYLLGPLPFLKTLITAMTDSSSVIVTDGYSTKKFIGWTDPISLNSMKFLSQKTGARFSSLVLSSLITTLQKNLITGKDEDHINVGVVSAMIPYKSKSLQNSFSTWSVPCPLRSDDFTLSLKEIDKALKAVSRSTEPIFNFFVMRMVGLLPRIIMDALFSSAGTPILFSNGPGPSREMQIFSSKVVDIGGWLPLIKTYGIGLAASSSSGRVRLCISADSKVIQSQKQFDKVVEDLKNELELLTTKMQCKISQKLFNDARTNA